MPPSPAAPNPASSDFPVIFDGHNDLPWEIREQGAGTVEWCGARLARPGVQTDLPRLREGGVGAQFWSVYVPSTLPTHEALTITLEQVDIVHRLIEAHPHTLRLATTPDEVRSALREDRIASLLGAEGGHSIGNSLGALRMLHRLGVRYLTLTHNDNNDWADSATDEPRHGGLSDFGVRVVGEMNRIGMIVDLSHVATPTMYAALAASTAPVIFSHSSARAVCDHPRNVPDEVLTLMARGGGVAMVTFVPAFVSPAVREWDLRARGAAAQEQVRPADWAAFTQFCQRYAERDPRPEATVGDVVAHLNHVREVAGIDHVGIGGDFDGTDILPQGLGDVSRYPALLQALRAAGWSSTDLTKLAHGNVLRVLDDVTARARQLRDHPADLGSIGHAPA